MRQRRRGSMLHGRSNSIWLLQRDGADCRAAAAKKSAKRTCLFGISDDDRKKRHQFCAKRLMNVVDERAPKFFVLFRSESSSDRARVCTILDRCQARNLGRQNPSSLRGFDFEPRNQENEIEAR